MLCNVYRAYSRPAAFRRLCVETMCLFAQLGKRSIQPPSGGCVLKHHQALWHEEIRRPAAFRRLCVETSLLTCFCCSSCQPPSGGCVLKHYRAWHERQSKQPAAFRRLCVETSNSPQRSGFVQTSRLQAAVC